MKRLSHPATENSTPAQAEICPIGDQYFALFQFLTDPLYDDGTLRSTGSLSIFTDEDGQLKGCLNDKDAGQVCFTAASNLSQLFKNLDTICKGEAGEWRKSRFVKGKKK